MASQALKILVFDANRIRSSIIEDGLRDEGAEVTVVSDVHGVVRRIAEIDPDIVVMDLESPSRDTLEHMFQVSRAIKRPVAMFVDRTDQQSIESAIDAGVAAYVVDGLKKERIRSVLETAMLRFRAFERLKGELEQARSELVARKVVERAKGILMRSRGLSENDAYTLLRKTAMDQGRRISEVADSLVVAAGLLGDDT